MNMKSILCCLLMSGLTVSHLAAADEKKDSNSTSTSQSISVNVNSSTHDDGVNGPKSKVSGKVVIVGADGVSKEFKLGDVLPDGTVLNLSGLGNQAVFPDKAPEPRPMIGVMSEPVGDLLRRHLKLGINGVVVRGVSEGLPAAESGIVEDDIILTANGKNITNQNDLAVVVKEAGEKEFDIELLRDGEKKTVTLKPQMTKPDEIPWIGIGKNPEQMHRFLFHRVGPGMQLQSNEDMDKQIKELMQKARKAAIEARKMNGNGVNMNRELTSLRKRVAELEKRLADDKTEAEAAE